MARPRRQHLAPPQGAGRRPRRPWCLLRVHRRHGGRLLHVLPQLELVPDPACHRPRRHCRFFERRQGVGRSAEPSISWGEVKKEMLYCKLSRLRDRRTGSPTSRANAQVRIVQSDDGIKGTGIWNADPRNYQRWVRKKGGKVDKNVNVLAEIFVIGQC